MSSTSASGEEGGSGDGSGLHDLPVWPAVVILLLVAGLALMAFFLLTTEVVEVRVRSGQWWFFLAASALATVLATAFTLGSRLHRTGKRLVALAALALAGVLLYLGLRFRPLAPSNLKMRLGLVPAFWQDAGLDVTPTEIPPDLVLLPEVDLGRLMPAPIDQGNCGSCWAVAVACMLSARFSLLLEREKAETGEEEAGVCGEDQRGWHASPQHILDMDSEENGGGATGYGCSTSPYYPSYGRCNSNSNEHGLVLAKNGVAPASCVPYFAGSSGRGCPTQCGSPQTDYVECPGGNRIQACVKPVGESWTECADGRELERRVRVTKDFQQAEGEAAIMAELQVNGPVVVGLSYYDTADWTLDWVGYKPDSVARPQNDGSLYTAEITDVGHAMVIYGYGERRDGLKYWLVRNSWGAGWGDGGSIKIERGVDAWGIERRALVAPVGRA
jgi:hypothetical protein